MLQLVLVTLADLSSDRSLRRLVSFQGSVNLYYRCLLGCFSLGRVHGKVKNKGNTLCVPSVGLSVCFESQSFHSDVVTHQWQFAYNRLLLTLSRLRNVGFVLIFNSVLIISIFDETRFFFCLIYFITQHLCLSINIHFDLKRLGPRHLYVAYRVYPCTRPRTQNRLFSCHCSL